MDLLGLGALAQVAVEWLALGTLSGVGLAARSGHGDLLGGALGAALLVGAVLVAGAQLGLALIGPGFASIPLVLIVAAHSSQVGCV